MNACSLVMFVIRLQTPAVRGHELWTHSDAPGQGVSLADRLAHLSYFRAVPPDRLDSLARHAVYHHVSAGEMILVEGQQDSRGLWVVEAGRVKVFRVSTDGREYILLLAGPGDLFNDIPALDGGPNPAHVLALTDVTAWTLSTDVLRAELYASPALMQNTIDLLAQRVRHLVQQLDDLALCSVPTRLARFLIRQAENDTLSGPGITRATIAAYLGTTPETVSRALRALEAMGAIRFDRQTILIVREDLLRAVALE